MVTPSSQKLLTNSNTNNEANLLAVIEVHHISMFNLFENPFLQSRCINHLDVLEHDFHNLMFTALVTCQTRSTVRNYAFVKV